jgi:signal transduction histidine kinase/AmiR/NasT family two-component response regulator
VDILGLCFDENATGAPFRHDFALVVLSFIVAFIASYTALELAERLRNARPGAAAVWHSASAVVLGGGIWSMHFIAMLAFETPLERGYDFGLTGLSMLAAIGAVAVGLWIVRLGGGWASIFAGGIFVGIGVVAMHYTGMAALIVAGEVVYRPSIFAVSVLIALTAATVALWLAFTLTRWWQRAGAAVVMATAICGMHYTGMAATVLRAGPEVPHATMPMSETLLAVAIALGVFGIVLIGLVGAIYNRRREEDAIREASTLRVQVAERTADLQRAAESLDAALERAERASAAKSDFLASTSHELRTPLNSILGFAQLLLDGKTFDPLTAQQSGAVQQMYASGRHLLQLIDEILDLSRIEAGKLSVSIETVDVKALIDDIVLTFQPAAIEAGITIHTAAPPPGLAAFADHRRMRQVLLNLVSNAVKYNKRGGEVSVTCRELDGWTQIAVSDTGAGIPQHLMGELFEPFNRLGQEQSPIVGTGVGLALCKRLVEAQNGWIRADSREGAGSTFTIGLPLAPSTASEESSVAGGTGATILYVEDNPSNVLLMRHIVKRMEGVNLLVAASSRDGIELARAVRPAVILLDINLPDMDGFEVLRFLKSNSKTSGIPVCALTANAMPREVERGKEAGFTRYLTKPINVPEFLAAMEELLEQAKPRADRFRRVQRV